MFKFKAFGLIGITLSLGCVTGCNKGMIDLHVFDDLKAWFSYKPGSYWIVRDSASGTVDSILTLGMHERPAEESGRYRSHSLTSQWLEFTPPASTAKATWGMILTPFEAQEETYLTYSDYMNPVAYEPFIQLPFVLSDNNRSATKRKDVTYQFLGSITIAGNTYDSVYRLDYYDSQSQRREYFLVNRAVGLVKFHQNVGSLNRTMEVIRYNIQHE